MGKGDVRSAARVAAAAVALVISGEVAGWHTALGVSTWQGLLIAAALVALLYISVLRCIVALSLASPGAQGLHDLLAAPLGRQVASLAGGAVAIATHVASAAGLIFFAGYCASLTGWPSSLILPATVMLMTLGIAADADARDRTTAVLASTAVLGILLFIMLALTRFEDASFESLALPVDAREVWRALPAAVWLFFAIEFTSLAVGKRPRHRDLAVGLGAGFLTLALLAFLVVGLAPGFAEPSRLASSNAPLVEAASGMTSSLVLVKLLAAFCAVSLGASIWGAVNAAVHQVANSFPARRELTPGRRLLAIAASQAVILLLALSGAAASLISVVVLIMSCVYVVLALATLRLAPGLWGWAVLTAIFAGCLAASSFALLQSA